MKTGLRLVAGALACSACLAPSAPAASADGIRQSAKAVFSERDRGASTALRLAIDYVNPADPEAKPPPVRSVALTLARGSRIDTGAVPVCEAADAELMTQGPAPCADSVVGGGVVTLDTGFPEPFRFLDNDLTLLNAADEVIFLFRQRQLGVRLASHAQIEGRTITATAPFLPGTPPDGAAADTVDETFNATAAGAYISTPPRCPRSRRWTNRMRFTYDDGVTQTVRSRSRCRRR